MIRFNDVTVGQTFKRKDTGKHHRVKKVTSDCITLEGCSMEYTHCVDRDPGTGIAGCDWYINSVKELNSKLVLVS